MASHMSLRTETPKLSWMPDRGTTKTTVHLMLCFEPQQKIKDGRVAGVFEEARKVLTANLKVVSREPLPKPFSGFNCGRCCICLLELRGMEQTRLNYF